MSHRHPIYCNGRTLTVRVPLTSRKRGGRKQVVAPEGVTWAKPQPQIDSTLVKAIARAYRWKRMLESQQFASIAELAHAEDINESYLCRVLRLTLLAPDLVGAALDGLQPQSLTLRSSLSPFPEEWERQRALWSSSIESGQSDS